MGLKCCCKHPDSRQCIRIRHPELLVYTEAGMCDPRDPFPEWAEDEVCECSCHYEDEDGHCDWDD